MSALRLANGGPVSLGLEIGRGGEGAVYQFGADKAVKLYLAPAPPLKARKLRAMSKAASERLLKISAWPEDLVLDAKGAVRGFVMPRAGGGDVHKLYSPKSRQNAFPAADFRFITHVAANVARAFATIHLEGHVIGDINHGHCLVGRDGRVVMIDCDSFQVRSDAETFYCDVGSALFTAPELHGKSFRGLPRTQDHDNFGLAVLLFHLLFMGRHPFAGMYSGAGDMPIDKAIVERRFAYSAQSRGLTRPPGAIALAAMPTAIGHLFEAAFIGQNSPRPGAESWIAPLMALKTGLKQCGRVGAHHFPNHLQACCWCDVEQATAARLFGAPLVSSPQNLGATIDLGALWRAIEAAPTPPPEPALPSAKPWTPPPGLKLPSRLLKQVRIYAALGLFGLGLVGCSTAAEGDGGIFYTIAAGVVAWFVWPRIAADKQQEALTRLRNAQAQWEGLISRWRNEAINEAYDRLRADLKSTRGTIEALPSIRADGIRRLEADRAAEQKHRYLDRFRIDKAKIPNIGPSRTTTLASFGIETAADVQRGKISRISGFGPALCNDLLKWRQSHERNFRFNAAEPVNPAAVAQLDAELDLRRKTAVAALRKGPDELKRMSAEIINARARLMPALERAWGELRVAQTIRDAM